MNKIICILLSILAITFAVSCSQPDNSSSINDGNGPSTNPDGTISGLISPVQLAQFRAEIVDATALGIKSDTVGSARGITLSRSAGDQNYLVKSTVEYRPGDIEYDNTGLTAVTFTRVTTTEADSEITGEKRLVAAGSKDYPHEGTVAFIATEGFIYDLYDESETLIYEGITDNCDQDYDKQEGVIRLGGLTKGTKYYARYTGTGTETTITQDDIDGEIDKVYVLGDYTFISFVPKGTSDRPSDDHLTYDSDGIATYDKTNYYSANDRVSFIISNNTGYIYLLENFNIREIQGGCLLSAEDNYIYDFRITDDNNLEIYALFTSDDISWYYVFKDKYGQVFILNDKIEEYYPDTRTQFYSKTGYILTSTGEALRVSADYGFAEIKSVSMVTDGGGSRTILADENFDIYFNRFGVDVSGFENYYGSPYKCEAGIIYGFFYDRNFPDTFGYRSYFVFDTTTEEYTHFQAAESGYIIADYALSNYDTLLVYSKSRQELRSLSNPFALFKEKSKDKVITPSIGPRYYNITEEDVGFDSLPLILEDASLSDTYDSFLTYGRYGTTYYDIIAEEDGNGNVVFNSYITGTYEKPQTKIVLQPINR